ncbi:MAG: hypothetical protein H6742_21320 [Alphaproteobacteria bacterium]|nr:hypothetical protein [Alphaproteobacteria bacterium]
MLPALPAWSRGALLGHGGTDLYPSVWGLWWWSQSERLLPLHTALLAFPDGMDLYYGSPLKGLLGKAVIPMFGLLHGWNLLVVAARVATVLAAGAAGRAFGLGPRGALVAAAVYGCAPTFHGFAVEGIVEGTDGWTLALWAWAIGRRRHLLAVPLLALTVLSSWYLGAAGLLLAALAGLRDRRAWASLLAPVLVAPAILAFASSFPEAAPLPDAVRAAMGSPLRLWDPALLDPSPRPFAISAWIGLLAPLLALYARRPWLALAAIPAVLSLGIGPWYDLPGLELLRFPYRLHTATLAILALAAGVGADRLGARFGRAAWLLGPLVALEGLLLSPVEPMLPGASAEVPAIYAEVDGPLLELPGPVAMPPGALNMSRPRARYLLYFQAAHQQPSPWVPDLNGVGTAAEASRLAPFAAWDPLVSAAAPDALPADTLADLAGRGVAQIMVQRRELGPERAERLEAALRDHGAVLRADDGRRALFDLASSPPPGAGAGR